MTYQEAAQNLINLYAKYVEVCTANEEDYSDFSEEIVIAVEALLIRADNERMNAIQKEYLTNLCGIPATPFDESVEFFENEMVRYE